MNSASASAIVAAPMVASLVTSGIAKEIIAEHDAAQGAKDNAIGHAIKAGELLLRVKSDLPHGGFLPWIAANLPFSQVTASAYMRVAKALTGPNQKRAFTLSIRQVLSISKGGAVDFPNAAALAKHEQPSPAPSVARDSAGRDHRTRHDKADVIKSMLAAGHNFEQIAAANEWSVDNVRSVVKEYRLAKLVKRGRGAARVSPARVITETVNTLLGVVHGLRLIQGEPMNLTKADAAALLIDLRSALKPLNRVAKLLSEISK